MSYYLTFTTLLMISSLLFSKEHLDYNLKKKYLSSDFLSNNQQQGVMLISSSVGLPKIKLSKTKKNDNNLANTPDSKLDFLTTPDKKTLELENEIKKEQELKFEENLKARRESQQEVSEIESKLHEILEDKYDMGENPLNKVSDSYLQERLSSIVDKIQDKQKFNLTSRRYLGIGITISPRFPEKFSFDMGLNSKSLFKFNDVSFIFPTVIKFDLIFGKTYGRFGIDLTFSSNSSFNIRPSLTSSPKPNSGGAAVADEDQRYIHHFKTGYAFVHTAYTLGLGIKTSIDKDYYYFYGAELGVKWKSFSNSFIKNLNVFKPNFSQGYLRLFVEHDIFFSGFSKGKRNSMKFRASIGLEPELPGEESSHTFSNLIKCFTQPSISKLWKNFRLSFTGYFTFGF